MVAKNLLSDVLALPVEDRLEFFEELRQNLNDPEVDALTDEHKRILDERLDDDEAGRAQYSTWDEFEARVQKSTRYISLLGPTR